MSRSQACASLALAVALVGGTGLRVLAEEPTSGIGAAVGYASPDGTAGGTTLRDVVDPFMGFAPDSPPGPDERYVLLTLRFQAADEKPFNAEPTRVVLRMTKARLVAHQDRPTGRRVAARPRRPGSGSR